MRATTTLRRAAAVPEIVEPVEAVRWVPCLLYAGTGRRLMAEEFEVDDYAGAIAAARVAAEADPLACGYAVLRRPGRRAQVGTASPGRAEDRR